MKYVDRKAALRRACLAYHQRGVEKTQAQIASAVALLRRHYKNLSEEEAFERVMGEALGRENNA